jgi:hypothetical protein
MLDTLFHSEFFKDSGVRYEKVKSPAELVAGVLRLTGEFDRPRREILDRGSQLTWMGQFLNNPPSVEGWHQGIEWIDTGTLVERINFASEQFGNLDSPGVKSMIGNILADERKSPGGLVDACLDEMGVLSVSSETRDALEKFAQQSGGSPELTDSERISMMLRLAATTHDFQRA